MTDRIRILIGASSQDYPGWIRTQQSGLDLTRRSDWAARFAPGTIETILMEHVWEHLTLDEAGIASGICHEFLRPGGKIRCAVPDRLFPNEEYQRIVRVGGPGPADHPAASHRVVYDYRTLASVFEGAGFRIRLLEWWDEENVFHAEPWDERDGFIYRSLRFDHRNQQGKLGFTSLIADAVKPENEQLDDG
jgi:predicted SAM-dependent methyltransferase